METSEEKLRVLILCTGNSARSQMAEGILRHEGGDRFEVFSAGTRPSRVRSEAIQVMREIGIDISSHRSKSVDEFRGQSFDHIITVCNHARETCPNFSGVIKQFHWAVDDPSLVDGGEEERLMAFRNAQGQAGVRNPPPRLPRA